MAEPSKHNTVLKTSEIFFKNVIQFFFLCYNNIKMCEAKPATAIDVGGSAKQTTR